MLKIIKLGLILTVFCILAAWGLAYVYLFTQPQISANAKNSLAQAQAEVLAGQSGKAIPVAPQGYSGKIELLVGISEDQKVTGVKVLAHKETPGLGAGVTAPQFLQQFVGKKISDPLEPKKDIDALTGATISTRAVCQGVKQALRGAKQ